MAKKKDKPEQGNGQENKNKTITTEAAQNLANEAFTEHPRINKVWVDEKKGEWHLVKRHGLKEFNRP